MFVFLAAQALCAPWGDYPLDDDWLYARTVKRLVDTGTLALDAWVAAPGIPQTLLAAPFVAIFGFSHTLLRLLTLLVACAGLWSVDRLLRHAGCPPRLRLCATLALGLTPFWFYLSATFMTEIHGLTTALLGAVVWFRARGRAAPDGPVVGAGAAVLVGAILGLAFWNRQVGVAWFGALVASGVLRLGVDGEWRRLRRSILPLAAGAGACLLVIGLYFVWAQSTGNLTAAFSQRLGRVSSFVPLTWGIQSAACAAYVTVFLSPLLALVRPRGGGRQAVWAAAGILAASAGAWFLAAQGGPEQGMHVRLRRFFPYLQHLFFNAGIGPVTFAEVNRPDYITWPHWPLDVFRVVHVLAVLAAGLWGLLLPRLGAFFRESRQAAEVFLFGLFGSVLSFIVTILGSGMIVFDRYHLPVVLGGVLAVGAFLAHDAADHPRTTRVERIRFGVPWLALSLFTVAGLHDHFRWQDARWTLARDYVSQGGSTLRLQAGYEVNAWYNYDAMLRNERPPYEEGCCHCKGELVTFCVDDTFWIGMAPPIFPAYRVVKSIQPRYWLPAGGRPVSLYRR